MLEHVGTFATAWQMWKKLQENAQRLKDAEIESLVLDFKEKLLDLRNDLQTLKEENQSLRERLSGRSGFDGLKAMAERRDGLIFLRDPPPHLGAGPHCPACFGNGKVQPLSKLDGPFAVAIARWACPACRATYNDD